MKEKMLLNKTGLGKKAGAGQLCPQLLPPQSKDCEKTTGNKYASGTAEQVKLDMV